MNYQSLKLLLAFLLPLAQTTFSAAEAPQGRVDYALEWGTSRQTYTYIFSGTVTCGGHPCAGAQVDVNLDSPDEGLLTQSTKTESDGHYLVQIQVQGTASEAASWKLMARSDASLKDPIEVEGQLILMQDETTVNVERPLMIG
jgi:hypothetical protein